MLDGGGDGREVRGGVAGQDSECCGRNEQSGGSGKQARTRQALISAATELFGRYGYDETTVADIAAHAEIGTRTFFSYFTSKEELLFPDVDARVQAAIDAITTRGAHERPTEVLLRALHDLAATDNSIVSD